MKIKTPNQIRDKLNRIPAQIEKNKETINKDSTVEELKECLTLQRDFDTCLIDTLTFCGSIIDNPDVDIDALITAIAAIPLFSDVEISKENISEELKELNSKAKRQRALARDIDGDTVGAARSDAENRPALVKRIDDYNTLILEDLRGKYITILDICKE